MKGLEKVVEACTQDLYLTFESGDLYILLEDPNWGLFMEKMKDEIKKQADTLAQEEAEDEIN
jgi:hypothetical protein